MLIGKSGICNPLEARLEYQPFAVAVQGFVYVFQGGGFPILAGAVDDEILAMVYEFHHLFYFMGGVS